jgi:hypothetical protein
MIRNDHARIGLIFEISLYMSATIAPERWNQSQRSLKPSDLMITQFF